MPTPESMSVPEKLSDIKDTKTAIHDAIVAKGVDVPDGTTFREYATKIDAIQDVASLPTQGAKTVTPTTTAQTAVPAGVYTTGAITVQGDANLVPENIAEGVSIFGVAGTLAGGSAQRFDTFAEAYNFFTSLPDSVKQSTCFSIISTSSLTFSIACNPTGSFSAYDIINTLNNNQARSMTWLDFQNNGGITFSRMSPGLLYFNFTDVNTFNQYSVNFDFNNGTQTLEVNQFPGPEPFTFKFVVF